MSSGIPSSTFVSAILLAAKSFLSISRRSAAWRWNSVKAAWASAHFFSIAGIAVVLLLDLGHGREDRILQVGLLGPGLGDLRFFRVEFFLYADADQYALRAWRGGYQSV